jgi:hypothetical protein
MITKSDARRTHRVSYKKSDGNEALSCSVEYSERGIHLSVDVFDSAYFAANPKELQEAVSDFVVQANGVLKTGGMPELK